MIVVSDTSPLVALWKMGFLEILPVLYGNVVIPTEVEFELRGEGHSDSACAIFEAGAGWLSVRTPTLVEAFAGLDPGETAAIALAKELRADAVIMDERAGRKVSEREGIPTVGTIGVLELAAHKGLLELAEAFERLKRIGFYVSQELLDSRLQAFQPPIPKVD
jgi:predicted nucleic acid-binding protein